MLDPRTTLTEPKKFRPMARPAMAAKMAKIGGRKVRSPRVPHSFWRDQCKNIIFALRGMHNPCRTSAWAKELPRKCGARGKSCLTTTERQRFRLAFGLAVR